MPAPDLVAGGPWARGPVGPWARGPVGPWLVGAPSAPDLVAQARGLVGPKYEKKFSGCAAFVL